MNERVATYYMDDVSYDVIACYNSIEDMDIRNVDFWDVYNNLTGACVNEGDPFYDFPTWDDVFENYYSQSN